VGRSGAGVVPSVGAEYKIKEDIMEYLSDRERKKQKRMLEKGGGKKKEQTKVVRIVTLGGGKDTKNSVS